MARKQQLIEGTEPLSIPEIDEKAEKYVSVRNKRMKLNLEEVQLRDELVSLMHEHNISVYDWDEQIVELTATEKIKVRQRKDAENGEAKE